VLNDEVIDLGVSVYVLKDNSPDEIRAALLAAADGRSWFSRSLTDFILNRQEDSHTLRKEVAGLDVISKTERKVLKLIAADLITKEIAELQNLRHSPPIPTHLPLSPATFSSAPRKKQISGNFCTKVYFLF